MLSPATFHNIMDVAPFLLSFVADSITIGPLRLVPLFFGLLRLAGLLLAVILLTRWIRRGRRSPLANALREEPTFDDEAAGLVPLAYLVVLLILDYLTGRFFPTARADEISLIIGPLAQIAGGLTCLAWICRGASSGLLQRLTGNRQTLRRLLKTVIVVFLLSYGICPVVEMLTVWIAQWIDPTAIPSVHPTLEALEDTKITAGMLLWLWIGAGLVAPIAEELFFRGILQPVLARVSGSRWIGVLAASAAFALVHVDFPLAMPALFVLGVLMGAAYERNGSLIVPIAIHALFNLAALSETTWGHAPG